MCPHTGLVRGPCLLCVLQEVVAARRLAWLHHRVTEGLRPSLLARESHLMLTAGRHRCHVCKAVKNDHHNKWSGDRQPPRVGSVCTIGSPCVTLRSRSGEMGEIQRCREVGCWTHGLHQDLGPSPCGAQGAQRRAVGATTGEESSFCKERLGEPPKSAWKNAGKKGI